MNRFFPSVIKLAIKDWIKIFVFLKKASEMRMF